MEGRTTVRYAHATRNSRPAKPAHSLQKIINTHSHKKKPTRIRTRTQIQTRHTGVIAASKKPQGGFLQNCTVSPLAAGPPRKKKKTLPMQHQLKRRLETAMCSDACTDSNGNIIVHGICVYACWSTRCRRSTFEGHDGDSHPQRIIIIEIPPKTANNLYHGALNGARVDSPYYCDCVLLASLTTLKPADDFSPRVSEQFLRKFC